jgi:sugar phosphate isomerase/epimerase
MDRLGIEFISAFSMSPVALVELAADVGCGAITEILAPLPDFNPEGHASWSLRDDPALRREMVAALRDRGVTFAIGEGFIVQPGEDQRDSWRADLDIMAELGVERISPLSFDPDRHRTLDQLAWLIEAAAAVGIGSMLEIVPTFGIGDLPTALDAIRHFGRSDVSLVIDTMHMARGGTTPAQLAALDPALIGHVQLCDSAMGPVTPDYTRECMYERLSPGEGELPLLDILAALPPGRVIGLEIPQWGKAVAGVPAAERLWRYVEDALALLARVEERRGKL